MWALESYQQVSQLNNQTEEEKTARVAAEISGPSCGLGGNAFHPSRKTRGFGLVLLLRGSVLGEAEPLSWLFHSSEHIAHFVLHSEEQQPSWFTQSLADSSNTHTHTHIDLGMPPLVCDFIPDPNQHRVYSLWVSLSALFSSPLISS